jgi:hypothetical protein
MECTLFGMNRNVPENVADLRAAAIHAHPEIVTQSIVAHMDVNTAYNGPSYGKVSGSKLSTNFSAIYGPLPMLHIIQGR